MYVEPTWAITQGNRIMKNVKKTADLLDRDDRRRLQRAKFSRENNTRGRRVQ